MRITTVETRTSQLLEKLCAVWESSVRETHLFLSQEEIERMATFVPDALQEIPRLLVAEREDGEPIAFLGIQEEKCEMLFVSPRERGGGVGKGLMQKAVKEYGVREVCVNEQNPQAQGFYEHLGFQTYRRTPVDEQGGPYPLLYLRLPRTGEEIKAAGLENQA